MKTFRRVLASAFVGAVTMLTFSMLGLFFVMTVFGVDPPSEATYGQDGLARAPVQEFVVALVIAAVLGAAGSWTAWRYLGRHR